MFTDPCWDLATISEYAMERKKWILFSNEWIRFLHQSSWEDGQCRPRHEAKARYGPSAAIS